MALLGSNIASEEINCLVWTLLLLQFFLVSAGIANLVGVDSYRILHQFATLCVGLRLLLCPLGSNIVLRTACCSVGIGIPVYCTCKAIERKDRKAQEKWLLYWAAYGSFSLVEIFSDKLISWCPMYYHLKFAFLVWLQLPSVDGAKQLYTNHLRPFFLKHQTRVDQVLGLTYGELHKLISAHQAEIEYARALVMKILGSDPRPNSDVPRQKAIEGQARIAPVSESDHED